MIKNLVIVESPAKAKTIEKFLGKDFTVKSCYGHIRDLAEGDLSIDIEKNFQPKYIVPDDKKKVVNELKKLAEDADIIWLATDEDREGEAISWHLMETLGLADDRIRRIVFHEITKPAILKAIENPRNINKNLVDAQQARRILDRLVGFEVSPILWRKIQPALSAGRVQSVAVRLIVEREREIIHFEAEGSYKVTALFHPVNKEGKVSESIIRAELPQRFKQQNQAEEFLQKCLHASYNIADIEVKPGYKSPAPPFTTSTLQQEASRKLGFSVIRTMSVAQKLYEAGHITYMRTDSVNLSELALADIKKEIDSQYGEKYSNRRQYTTKSASAQEAHEAIRPTYISRHSIGESDDGMKRLYDLIWKRTIASQMANAQLEKTNVKINVSTTPETLIASGEVLKFDGFLKVYLESNDDEDDEESKSILPPLSIDQALSLVEMTATERFSKPAARYTEASLVRKLEELSIGRPSTYAPTITTIQKRNYVVKGDKDGEQRAYHILTLKNKAVKAETQMETYGREKSKLFPTNIGMLVNDFLVSNFENILDYQFTASVEKEFDEIADGSVLWQNMIGDFYKPFHESVENTIQSASRVKGERLLGVDPKTGKSVVVKIGRYGPFAQIGDVNDDEKPQFAKLQKGQLLETITLDEAMELFKLPRQLGSFEESPVVASIGRFGPYISHNKAFYSIPKDEDPYSIELDRAIELIKKLREEKENKVIKELEHEGKPVMILRGRFGPYMSYNKSNYKIPKGMEPTEITLEEAIELINKKPAATAKKRGGRKIKK